MEPQVAITILDGIKEQGFIVLILCLAIYFGAKYVVKERDKIEAREAARQDIATKREDARELRYNQLVDKLIDVQGNQVQAVTTALVGNTAVLQRVERKLEVPNGGQDIG